MIDRLFPGLFPWAHLSIIATGILGLVWCFWPEIRRKFAASPSAEPSPPTQRKEKREPSLLTGIAVLVGFIFAMPWVYAALVGVLYASAFVFGFVSSGFDVVEAKLYADRVLSD